MKNNSAFNILIKTFINCLAKSSERISAHNTIFETNYNTLKEVTTNKKRWKSWIRAVLKEKYIVIARDVYEQIIEAEKASYKKKSRKSIKE